MFDSTIYVETLYGKGNSPFDAWLRATNEKALFQEWLRDVGLPQLDIGTLTRPVHVLDLGASSGSTSMRGIVEMQRYGLREIVYYAVDPYREQLDTFERNAAPLTDVELVTHVDGIESFTSSRMFDLVIANHSLYYVQDMSAAVKHMLRLGRETIIVYHGQRGINSVQQAFPQHVHPGPNVLSTSDNVAKVLATDGVVPMGMTVRSYQIVSTVNVSCFGDEEYDEDTCNNLTSFFLQRPIKEISAALRTAIRAFIREEYPDGRMIHDVTIFVIS